MFEVLSLHCKHINVSFIIFFGHQICFLLVNLVHQIITKRYDAFVISIHPETTVVYSLYVLSLICSLSFIDITILPSFLLCTHAWTDYKHFSTIIFLAPNNSHIWLKLVSTVSVGIQCIFMLVFVIFVMININIFYIVVALINQAYFDTRAKAMLM